MKDKKYKAVTVDVGAEAAVAVVTNAKHADVGERVVVAMVGAIVPAGADPEDAITVAKASVGGRASCGMLCDATMLGWKGANGVAVKLGEDFAIGAPPPDAKCEPCPSPQRASAPLLPSTHLPLTPNAATPKSRLSLSCHFVVCVFALDANHLERTTFNNNRADDHPMPIQPCCCRPGQK
jgi:tRNA-binding EMAP/Myf-like protein